MSRLFHLASAHRSTTTPLRAYFDLGLIVTLNSDDPPMFGASLLDEYALAHPHFGFSLSQLRELAANSVEASFLPPPASSPSSPASSNTANHSPIGSQ